MISAELLSVELLGGTTVYLGPATPGENQCFFSGFRQNFDDLCIVSSSEGLIFCDKTLEQQNPKIGIQI